jgi:hypothetical protein
MAKAKSSILAPLDRIPRSQKEAGDLLRERDEAYEILKQKKRLTRKEQEFVLVYELELEEKRPLSREEAIERFKQEEEVRALLTRAGFLRTRRMPRPH